MCEGILLEERWKAGRIWDTDFTDGHRWTEAKHVRDPGNSEYQMVMAIVSGTRRLR